ncbi:MAG: hypothetical protein EA362_03430 [Saprospirales bacterium]|nr:MAG: hypothetical protein EA362_03430 [Saprospirales bacterium]
MRFPIVLIFSFFLIYSLLNLSACQEKAEVNLPKEPIPYKTLPDFICAHGDLAFDSIDIQTFEDGSHFSITFLSGGQPHGQQLIYYENGEIKTRRHYCLGEINGPFTNYYEDGTIQVRGYYHEGRMSGSWHFYYPDGKPKEVVYFIDNEERGPFREYHKNGQLKASGYYIGEDREHGLLYLYEEDGELKRRMRCNNGICFTISS